MRDIDFGIRKGERVLLLGENGCGKTTLLRLMARLYAPTKGNIIQNIDTKFGQKPKGTAAWFRKVGKELVRRYFCGSQEEMYMVKITLGIEGMACGMCEAHVNDAIRNACSIKKVTSSHTKKQAVIIAEKDIAEQELKDVVAKAGYDVTSVSSEPYEKKRLFR